MLSNHLLFCLTFCCTGDKQYQEQVLIELASKAGQMAVQHTQQQQQQDPEQQQSAAAEALMAQAQQLAASYGADPFQLELWFVHSLVLYAPDINQPDAQSLLAAHTQQLLRHPAAAAAHLYYNTYALLPAAAAGQCACALGLIHSTLQAVCAQQQQQQQGDAGTAAVPAGGSSSSAPVPVAITVALPQLEKLRELLVKSHKALGGVAAKALIGGHVALMVGPAVAAAAAMADSAASTSSAAARQGREAESPPDSAQQQQQDPSKHGEAADAAAAAAVASVDLQMVLLEAASAVSAFVTTPGQAGVVAKFIRHMNTLAEMHARASVGDKPKQQALQKLAQGVSPGLPHLLLFMRTMSSGIAPEQQYWADADEQDSSGLTRVNSGESFQSAISVSSSQLSGQNAAHPGHNPAAAMAIEWATARARYAGSSGRQQLLNCSALQLSGVAGWLAMSQQQPVSADAIGHLQPLATGPGLQLQLLTDVITLITNPEAQLSGMVAGTKRISSGSSSRGSSFHLGAASAEQAAATAVAAAAALSSGPATGPVGGLTPLMRDDPAAIAAWQPPIVPTTLPHKRRELVAPLLQAAARVVAKHVVLSAVAAAAPAGAAAGSAAEAAVEDMASIVAQAAAVGPQEQQQQQQVVQASCMLKLLQALISAGSFPAVAALLLAHQLTALQLAVAEAMGQQQQQQEGDGAVGAAGSGSSSAAGGLAGHQAMEAVSSVLQLLTRTALQNLQQQQQQQHIAAEQGGGSSSSSALQSLQLLIRCLEQDAAAPTSSPIAAAAGAEEAADADSAAGAGLHSSSWLQSCVQELRCQLWDALQQHQAQLPAEAYSSSLVAELLELLETVSSGAVWPGWSSGVSGASAAAGAAVGAGEAGGRPKGSGAGLLLARTMTALSKQFPGLKVS
jgi:hypothetical protein